MRTFEHINVHTIEEALETLGQYKEKALLNAGGTDLIGRLKDDILPGYPEAIVNAKNIPDLDYIREEGGFLKIGALAKLFDLAASLLIRERYGVLAQAANSVASPQIRNVATIGGNICQEVRCWYYRYPRHVGGPIQCARKGSGPCLAVRGDNRYHAIMGGKKCFAVCPSDTAVALAALDAGIVVAGPDGERSVKPVDFYNPMANVLGHGEMVREITIPVKAAVDRQSFLKFTLRKPIDFAIVSVASVLTVEKGICTDARIILGAVAPGPVRAEAAEKVLIGNPVTEDCAERAAQAALTGAKPLNKNEYKIQIAKTLVKRAIMADRP